MSLHAAGFVSTEDEDDMPYDMYTNKMEGMRLVNGKESNKEREKGKEKREEDVSTEALQENIVTNVVIIHSHSIVIQNQNSHISTTG